MKKIIDFCSTLPFVQRSSNRHLCKNKNFPNYTAFYLLQIFLYNRLRDSFIRIYEDCILIQIYQTTQIAHSDFISETKKMCWGMQEGGWNWYEISLHKINKNNEDIIFQLIKTSYDISYNFSKNKYDLNKVVSQIDIDDNKLLDAYIDYNNAQHLKDIIISHQRKSVLLIETKKRAFKGTSKIGGCPDLPLDFSWPNFENKPLTFLAQINLAEIVYPETILPKNGMLYFFIAITSYDDDYYHFLDVIDRQGVVQVFYSNNSELKKCLLNNFKFNEVVLNTKIVNSYPESPEEKLFNDSTLSEKEVDLINEVADMYYETIDHKLDIENHHNLLGYYRPVQDMHPDAQDYITLLQISSSDNVGMNWGDSGMLYIYIHKDDLIKLDFSKIIIDTQCG